MDGIITIPKSAHCETADLKSVEVYKVPAIKATTREGEIEVEPERIDFTLLQIAIDIRCPGEMTEGDKRKIFQTVMDRLRHIEL